MNIRTYVLVLGSSIQLAGSEAPPPNPLYQKLITAARTVRLAAFGARAAVVTVAGAAVLYDEYGKTQEASDVVKQFCYEQAGRSDFKIKAIRGASSKNFSAGFNTLYVPTGIFVGLESTLKSLAGQVNPEAYFYSPPDEAKRELNLYKGILDHEFTHLKNRDSYRGPALLIGSFVAMEKGWSKIRPRLENYFKKQPYPAASLRAAAHIAGRWGAVLVLPTALYTGTFFCVRQMIKKTIERQADAGVRDDIDVLTAMKENFDERAQATQEHKHPRILHYLELFFDSHPTDKSRAEYFAQRIKHLQKN